MSGAVPNVGLDGKGQAPVGVSTKPGNGLPATDRGPSSDLPLSRRIGTPNQPLTVTSGKTLPKPQGYGY